MFFKLKKYKEENNHLEGVFKMKRTSKRILSVILAVMLLCSVMSINAFAATGTVTIYFTRGNFTSGGYDFVADTFIPSVYQGTNPPSPLTYFGNGLTYETYDLATITTNLSSVRAVYDAYGEISGDVNVLDVIIYALVDKVRTPDAGIEYDWNTYEPLGGAIYGFQSDGSTDYYGYTEYVAPNGHKYNHYTGTNWQIAYGTNSLAAASTYGTNIPATNGMVIVFDLSAYDMYYKVS